MPIAPSMLIRALVAPAGLPPPLAAAWWEHHQWLVVAGITVVSVIGYLWSRRRIAEYRRRNLQLQEEIAQRETAEEAMRKSDARYQGFIQNSTEVIWCVEFDPPLPLELTEDEQVDHLYRHGKLMEANEAYAASTGHEHPEKLLGMTTQEIMPREIPENEAAVREMIRSRFTMKDMISREPNVDGEIFIARNNMVSTIENGRVIRVWGTAQIITEEVRVREQLETAEEKYRTLVVHANEAIFVSVGAKLAFSNPQAARMLGYAETELHDMAWIDLIHPDARDKVREEFQSRISGEKPVASYATRMVTQDGQPMDVLVNSARITWEGAPASLVMITDISRRVEAERDAREQRNALARVDRAASMGQLTGAIAHELNQPLTGILSNAQAGELLIGRDPLDRAEIEAALTEIVADAKRAGGVITNLRELYRNHQVETRPVDVNVLVEDTLRLMRGEFVLKNIEVQTKLCELGGFVLGNRIQLQQVLVNLMLNANEAMVDVENRDRFIRVRTAAQEDGIELFVEDGGSGIPSEHLQDIFVPMTTWKSGGTGMGLAISQSIVSAHGGRMTAENHPGGGARVGFVLPLDPTDRDAGPAPQMQEIS